MFAQTWHLTTYCFSQAEADWSHLPASISDQQRTLILSVTDGEDLVRSVQDISRMPFTEFVKYKARAPHPLQIAYLLRLC